MKKQEKVGGTGEGAGSKKLTGPSVGFPWKWVGVGVVVFIIILSVIILRPILPGSNPTNSNASGECINGKTLVVDYVVSLQIFITDSHRDNYTQLIPHGIGTDPVNGQACTRRLHTEYDYNSSNQAAKIHVESPEEKNFTLGDFFYIWNNQSIGPDAILSFQHPPWRIVFQDNDGLVADTNTNPGYHYEAYRLRPDRNLVFHVYD